MRNNFKEAREFECCNCGLKFKIQSDEEIIQKLYDEDDKCTELEQECIEQIYCVRCGDTEAFPIEVEVS